MRLNSFSLRDDQLEISWEDGGSARFHYIWLRDNCLCPECRHPDAWERTLDPVMLPLDLKPRKVDANVNVAITWEDGHRSSFSSQWLIDHIYERDIRAKRLSAPSTWTAASIAANPPLISYTEIAAGDAGLRRWLTLIRDHGFSIVHGVATRRGQVVDLAERIAHIQETNFGRSFQVASKPDPENLAYTAVKLTTHTDVPNRRGLPGLQFLHCLEFAAQGGESILVDGYEAARRLAEQHPEDHRVLTEIAVPYRFQDDDHDIFNRFPVIGVGEQGQHEEIRFHTGLMAPLDIDPALVTGFYRAMQNFARILRSPDLEFEFKMQPGDCQVFDNRRILHARAEFDPNSGPRHFEGTYVDRDDFLSRLCVLERDGADFRKR